MMMGRPFQQHVPSRKDTKQCELNNLHQVLRTRPCRSGATWSAPLNGRTCDNESTSVLSCARRIFEALWCYFDSNTSAIVCLRAHLVKDCRQEAGKPSSSKLSLPQGTECQRQKSLVQALLRGFFCAFSFPLAVCDLIVDGCWCEEYVHSCWIFLGHRASALRGLSQDLVFFLARFFLWPSSGLDRRHPPKSHSSHAYSSLVSLHRAVRAQRERLPRDRLGPGCARDLVHKSADHCSTCVAALRSHVPLGPSRLARRAWVVVAFVLRWSDVGPAPTCDDPSNVKVHCCRQHAMVERGSATGEHDVADNKNV